ncbi:DUF2309 domain-containing protein [Staphylococcus arlettae]|uniref:DUF2309 domain-containing protein n=1 Tax=Staphylococcus arlettae TaxID=29378 RepID=UPI001137F18F|nr:putative inorganic carbon transporter subunit DabA [Staphylococcus arlettae]MCD9053977.1 Na-translocating system protein MpsB [Staphylococcus arlettae]UXU50162.1 Na-translocating system protein MpsB [Staphylococcus arlettae]BBK27106.1 UPF0753 protein YbcC [Staphylococcus arlettae]
MVTAQSTAHKQLHNDSIEAVITRATKVIVPLSPISIFAARHPWVNLEDKQFETIGRWLDNSRDVDIFPGKKIIKDAYQKGEIEDSYLVERLEQWIEQQQLNVPFEVAKQYGSNALKLDDQPLTIESESYDLAATTELPDDDVFQRWLQRSMPPRSKFIKHKPKESYLQLLDYHVIKWCKLYLDENQSSWTMPGREEGFFYAWQRLVTHDPALSKVQRQALKQVPSEPLEVIAQMLEHLAIPHDEIQGYLENHLLALPGWAGMLLWQNEKVGHKVPLITEYLAIRLALEWVFIQPFAPFNASNPVARPSVVTLINNWIHWGGLTTSHWNQLSMPKQHDYLKLAQRLDDKTCRTLWLEAWEDSYAQQLRHQLTNVSKAEKKNDSTQAQLAFCIDVRSEQFRRQLEAAGPFETIGIAGFFGIPIESCQLGSHHSHASLPVMNEPLHKVKEVARPQDLQMHLQRKYSVSSLIYTFKKMKQNVLPSLLLPELSGSWLSVQMFSRSFVPRPVGNLIQKFYKNWFNKPKSSLTLTHEMYGEEDGLPVGFTKEEKVTYVKQGLELMGLTHDFSPLVVLCGHGSQSANNPYASSLDCGACGGAASGFNAKVLAMLCNLEEVREALINVGITIPQETVFVAAQHNTALDELDWIYVPNLSTAAQTALTQIKAAMPQVSLNANAERMLTLPRLSQSVKNAKHEAQRLAHDWSEIRPEWGLARNASFIIGQRTLTQQTNLEGRAFLQNYDWRQDPTGSILANIIAGPATVAQWINLQYYASTVAPHYYGSGSKTTHTVTGGLGVMQGNASDLLTGLPWQSVMKSDYEAYHAPLRLLIVIQAPDDHIDRLLQESPNFKQKVDNNWLHLANITPDGQWHIW